MSSGFHTHAHMQAYTPAHISAPPPKQGHINTQEWGEQGVMSTVAPEDEIARVYEKRGRGARELIETPQQPHLDRRVRIFSVHKGFCSVEATQKPGTRKCSALVRTVRSCHGRNRKTQSSQMP